MGEGGACGNFWIGSVEGMAGGGVALEHIRRLSCCKGPFVILRRDLGGPIPGYSRSVCAPVSEGLTAWRFIVGKSGLHL